MELLLRCKKEGKIQKTMKDDGFMASNKFNNQYIYIIIPLCGYQRPIWCLSPTFGGDTDLSVEAWSMVRCQFDCSAD